MKITNILPACLLLAMASMCQGQQKTAGEMAQLPELLLDHKGEFAADFRKLPDGTRTDIAFAFRTPRLFDGPVTWLVVWGEENPAKAAWRVIAEDGSAFGVFPPVLDDLKLYPDLAARFPAAKSVQRVRIAREKLDESRRYEAVLTLGADARSPLGISVNAASSGVVGSGAARKLDIPQGWIPSPLVMELTEQTRALQGDAAAFDFLLAQLTKKVGRRSEFLTLFGKVWDEAQFGTGYTDPAWGSKLNDAAFTAAYRAGYYKEAFSITGNLIARLSGSGRFGRLAEVHGIVEETYRGGGMRMEISAYPDLGPAIESLPVVRHRKMPYTVPFPERLPGGAAAISRPTDFGPLTGAFLSYGWQKMLGGEWREGLEWTVWVRDWASDENGMPIQARNGTWYGATMNIAEILFYRGFHEEALAMIEGAVAAPYGKNYRSRAKIGLAVRRLDLMREAGRPDPEMIPKLRELAGQIENHLHFGKSGHWYAKACLARALLHEGQLQEGEQLLDTIIAEGSVDGRRERLAHWISIGRAEGVEAELIALLRAVREDGHKIFELSLYEKYADFLEKTGRLEESLAMRRAAIRLCRDFDAFDRLPIQLAKLAALLEAIRDEEGSKQAAGEALALIGGGGLPASTVKETGEMLAKLKPAAAVPKPPAEKTDPQVDLQPQRSVVIPLGDTPWTSYLTLTNPGAMEQRGRLSFTGAAALLSEDGETQDITITLDEKTGRDGQTAELTLAPASYRLITIVGAGEMGMRELKLDWAGANAAGSTVRIDEPEAGVAGAVIQAGNYQANPFYGVPMHLSYVSKIGDAASPPLRFVASQLARVEIYQLNGTPLAIDGQGNGSLLNPGDQLFGQSDGAGNIVLPLHEGSSAFQVIVYPDGKIAEEGLQVDVEVFGDGKWNLHSRNLIAR